jgi:hypothetical protein
MTAFHDSELPFRVWAEVAAALTEHTLNSGHLR